MGGHVDAVPEREVLRTRRRARVGAGALVVLVGCSLLFVVVAADRLSLFAATSHAGFFPG